MSERQLIDVQVRYLIEVDDVLLAECEAIGVGGVTGFDSVLTRLEFMVPTPDRLILSPLDGRVVDRQLRWWRHGKQVGEVDE